MTTVTCIRCDTSMPVASFVERCPSSPSASAHEGIAPPEMRPRGWSLHAAQCPAGAPYMTGHELSDAACTCGPAVAARRQWIITTEERPARHGEQAVLHPEPTEGPTVITAWQPLGVNTVTLEPGQADEADRIVNRVLEAAVAWVDSASDRGAIRALRRLRVEAEIHRDYQRDQT